MQLFFRQFLFLFLIPATIFANDTLVISKIFITPKDAFDDAAINTSLEKKLYEFGNWFHIETKESVIRDRLPFAEGDTVCVADIQEAEKNLRALSYISDAKIEAIPDSNGTASLFITTNDNWTFSPSLSFRKSGEELLWSVGILENNLLGLGHSVGFFFAHQEDRDQKYLLYKSDDFFIPHHSFNFIWSENSDGFSRSMGLEYPFISRSKNQWAYSADFLWSKRNENFYESKNPNPIAKLKNLKEDSLSFDIFRSFGGASFKTYLGLAYDYHYLGGGSFPLASTSCAATPSCDLSLQEKWQTERANSDIYKPNLKDSRIGISFAMSRIRFEKLYNLHKVKWAEDIERGYYLQTKIAKNFKELNAANDYWYFEHIINLSFGTPRHNFYLSGKNSFYYGDCDSCDYSLPQTTKENSGNSKINNMYSYLFGEYIYKPSLRWSSVFDFQIDSWQKTSYLHQLYLDGNNIFPGFPSYYLAGENTFMFKAEQRYFTNFEILTQIPTLAVFVAAGEASDRLRSFEPRDLQYEAGIGLRVSSSKSVQGIVSHINLSFPLNGSLGYSPRFSFVGKVGL